MTPDTLEERIRHIIDDLHVDWFKEKADKRYVVEAIKALIEEETDKVEERYVGRLADEIFRREALEAKLKIAEEALEPFAKLHDIWLISKGNMNITEWLKILDENNTLNAKSALDKIRSSEGGEG